MLHETVSKVGNDNYCNLGIGPGQGTMFMVMASTIKVITKIS